jgi:uncharacterized protein (TIGR04255 family)
MQGPPTGMPLVLTAFEVRYPASTAVHDEGVLACFADAMVSRLPIASTGEEARQYRTPLGFGAHRNSVEPAIMVLRDEERTSICTVRETVASVEVTNYSTYYDYRALIEQFLRGLVASRVSFPVERVGLRYLDEVRPLRGIEQPDDWHGWIADDLLRPLTVAAGLPVSTYTGLLRAELGDQKFVSLRYGALRRPALMQNTGIGLRIRRPNGAGPVFMLDIDGYWLAGGIECDEQEILPVVDELHEAVARLFEASIGEVLQDHFKPRSRLAK